MTGSLSKVQNMIKPLFVYIAFTQVEMISLNYGGTSNPTINLIMYIWSIISYNYGDAITTKNYFDENHLGRYTWIYILAPIVASIFAGLFAGMHAK